MDTNHLSHEPDRDPWPEIDRLPPDTAVDFVLSPSWYSSVKVVLDYLTAAVLLVASLPLMLLAVLAVRLTSPGPMFYTQTRTGLNGRPYRIIKIRTMYHDCEKWTGPQWSQRGDLRVTRAGRLLRATHLDELPQLVNVLMGEMSLVGPRPERPEVIRAKGLTQLVPGYGTRHLVKPGVTGLAQLQLPADSDITSVRYKVVYDLYYIQNQSPFLDSRLLLATLCKAAGVGPTTIRRLFRLPDRERVADFFQSGLTAETPSLSELLPA